MMSIVACVVVNMKRSSLVLRLDDDLFVIHDPNRYPASLLPVIISIHQDLFAQQTAQLEQYSILVIVLQTESYHHNYLSR